VKQSILVMTLALAGAATMQAGTVWLDLSSVTPGTSGVFQGALGSVSVTGSITNPNSLFRFNDACCTNSWEQSTIDGTSPQFSYSDVYDPSTPSTDKVGYTSFAGTARTTIHIQFSSPVTNPIFNVANLDGSIFDFGAISLMLLSGNGGADGDGLQIVGNTIRDGIQATAVGLSPTVNPPKSGARSGYGSVMLLGTFSSLDVVNANLSQGDGGSFTLSAVPEPSTFGLTGTCLLLALGYGRRRRNSR
jgi:hypothetical protein